ncbi:MAG: hypothetical protein EOP02_38010, partial [Proteobacteria bacterium]
MTTHQNNAGRQGGGLGLIRRLALGLPFGVLLAGMGAVTPAYAHVKWFAPYVVGAAPAPITSTLTNSWFWLGIVLVLGFFAVTVVLERGKLGTAVTGALDWASAPLWVRSDDFMRAI